LDIELTSTNLHLRQEQMFIFRSPRRQPESQMATWTFFKICSYIYRTVLTSLLSFQVMLSALWSSTHTKFLAYTFANYCHCYSHCLLILLRFRWERI